MTRGAIRLLTLLLAWLALCTPAAAHEIPTDVRVTAFLRTDGPVLRLLMRVPLAAMREAELPLRGPGYLVLDDIEPRLRDAAALWLTDRLQVTADDRALPPPTLVTARVSLASDRHFADHDQALQHLRSGAPLTDTDLVWTQQWLDLMYEWPLPAPVQRWAIHWPIERLGLKVSTSLRFQLGDATEQAWQLHGSIGPLALNPGWLQAASRFTALGVTHILSGVDHLLFVAALVLPFTPWRRLVWMVTGFTLAHSLTLALAALGVVPQGLWFAPAVEFAIAATVLAVALDNVLRASAGRRAGFAFALGLVHGFGFSFALAESLQFAGSHLLTALAAFNVGVELGQLAVLLLLVPLLRALQRLLGERPPVWVGSALVAHAALHWLDERWQVLSKFLPALG
ncbi:MAG: HupE/UreJ family protein [Rubrivivax sp.]